MISATGPNRSGPTAYSCRGAPHTPVHAVRRRRDSLEGRIRVLKRGEASDTAPRENSRAQELEVEVQRLKRENAFLITWPWFVPEQRLSAMRSSPVTDRNSRRSICACPCWLRGKVVTLACLDASKRRQRPADADGRDLHRVRSAPRQPTCARSCENSGWADREHLSQLILRGRLRALSTRWSRRDALGPSRGVAGIPGWRMARVMSIRPNEQPVGDITCIRPVGRLANHSSLTGSYPLFSFESGLGS